MTPLTTDVTPKGEIYKTSKFLAQMRPAEAFPNRLVYYYFWKPYLWIISKLLMEFLVM